MTKTSSTVTLARRSPLYRMPFLRLNISTKTSGMAPVEATFPQQYYDIPTSVPGLPLNSPQG